METGTKKYGVSVILSLYNSKKFFQRAFDSLKKQTLDDFEVVIVDDGSTDEIEQVLFPMLRENDNYKYIRHSNRKHPMTLNTGILNSNGRYITFLDSDDEYLPDHLSRRYVFMSENPEIDLIHSPAKIIGEEKDMFVPDARDTSKLIHLKDCIIGGTFFGKRKVFEELNGFKNIYSHDFDFYNRAYEKFTVLSYDLPTYVYHRENSESVINKMKAQSNQ